MLACLGRWSRVEEVDGENLKDVPVSYCGGSPHLWTEGCRTILSSCCQESDVYRRFEDGWVMRGAAELSMGCKSESVGSEVGM